MDGKAHAGSEKEGCPTIRRQLASLLFWNGIRKPLYLNLLFAPKYGVGMGLRVMYLEALSVLFVLLLLLLFFNLLYAM